VTRILILGAAGSVGRVILRELLDMSSAQLVAADLEAPSTDDLNGAAAMRVTSIALDVGNSAALAVAVREAAIVVNATAMRYAMPITRTAIAERIHLVDLGTFHDTIDQLGLAEEAAAAGVCIVIGAGVAPGLTNLLARYGAERLDHVDRISIHSFLVNAMFESPANILDRFDARRLNGLTFRDGKLVRTEPLAEVEAVEFAPPEGRQLVHLMPHPETLTLPRSLGVANVEFKTGYPPAEDEILESFRATDLDSAEPFAFGGARIAPREFVAAVAGTRRRGSISTANLKRVTVEGTKYGQPVRLLYEMAVRAEGGSATSRITGTMAAIAALEVIARGVPGVHPAEGGLEPAAVLQVLAGRGYHVTETQTTTRSLLAP
jgi:saccharopine dehydrogenase-like NADP-dependent oxidoreductase